MFTRQLRKALIVTPKLGNMFGMFGGFGLGGGAFDSNYRAYPVSFIDKNDAEHADKVFLPPSALDRLGMFLQHA